MINNYLLLDTATEALSAVIVTPDKTVHHFEECPQQHSQKILPVIEQLCTQTNISLQQIQAIGFGKGPGSFTGVRIAISTVQGLALGLNVPVYGISTLACMAQASISTQGANDVLVAIDARMSEVYFAHYTNNNGRASLVGAELVMSPQVAAEIAGQKNNVAYAGTGWLAYKELQPFIHEQESLIRLPDSQYMIPLFLQGIEDDLFTDVDAIEPSYLRDKVTWKKLPGKE